MLHISDRALAAVDRCSVFGPRHASRTHRPSLRSLRALFSVAALVLFLSLSAPTHAQSTFGALRGIVSDPSGAVIPQAALILHSEDENTDRTLVSSDTGEFQIENLKPGLYRITASKPGFTQVVVKSIRLDARQDLRIPITMNVVADTTTVEVSASSAQLNTEDGTISSTTDNTLITGMPLNTRASSTSPLGALQLSASVQQDSSGNLSVSGASASMVNFSVDGVSTANVRQNGALQDAYPSQEGIAALKVTAFNNSAEFSQVGDVTFTTKGGANTFHGSLFEYLQNDIFDAAPYGYSSKSPKRYNTFGGSFSGPFAVPHFAPTLTRGTFFFFDYEGNRRRTATAQQFLVPTQAERQGDLTALGGPVIPTGDISATAAAVLARYPLPNVTGQSSYNYVNFQSIPSNTDGADLRIDRILTKSQSVYARFSRKNILSDTANSLLPNDESSIHNRSLLVSYTASPTTHLVNEFRFGITNVATSVDFPIEGADALTALGLTGVDISQHPTAHAYPTFNFNAGTGFTSIGRDKAGVTVSHTLQFTDNLTAVFGRHTFKTGVDLRRVRYSDLESFAPVYASDDFGDFVFQSTFSGLYCGSTANCSANAFGDFLLGAPTTLNFAVSSPDVAGTAWQTGFFAQDEFQLSSRITLNYGLRWQLLPAFNEDGGNLANFDQRNNTIVVPDALAAYLQKQNIEASNLGFRQSFNSCDLGYTALPCTGYATASADHVPQGLRSLYFGNFQPRVSLAYRPFNNTKTVVRMGFGVFTITNLGPLSFNNSGNPTSALHTYTNTAEADRSPTIQFPRTAPASSGVTYGGGGLDQGVDPRYRDPQSNQWNLTLEQAIGADTTLRASYVGMHTYRLSVTEDLNQLPASTTPFQTTTASPYVDPRSPYPNWLEIYTTFNAGKANYHALQLQATHNLSHGLYLDANYTFAKNLADNQGDVPTAFAGEVNYGLPIADRFHIPAAYGNVEGGRRQRFLTTARYQLPFGAGRPFSSSQRWVNSAFGGWELSSVILLETGPWLTPSISPGGCQVALSSSGSCPTLLSGIPETNDQSNTNVLNRGAQLRPDQLSSHFAAGRTRSQYFNPAAFQATPVGSGRFGNAGVGILQGPGTETASLSLARVIAVTESVHLRFDASFTNLFNHTNFLPPATAIDNTQSFGVLSQPQTAENAGNRTGQFSLRLDF